MRGAVLHAPGDVRVEQRDDPKIVQPTDAIIRLSATCICGSDLWPYRGIEAVDDPAPMGHEYVGVVEEVGRDVRDIEPGQFVVGSFSRPTARARSVGPATTVPASTASSWAPSVPRRSAPGSRSLTAHSSPPPSILPTT